MELDLFSFRKEFYQNSSTRTNSNTSHVQEKICIPCRTDETKIFKTYEKRNYLLVELDWRIFYLPETKFAMKLHINSIIIVNGAGSLIC